MQENLIVPLFHFYLFYILQVSFANFEQLVKAVL